MFVQYMMFSLHSNNVAESCQDIIVRKMKSSEDHEV